MRYNKVFGHQFFIALIFSSHICKCFVDSRIEALLFAEYDPWIESMRIEFLTIHHARDNWSKGTRCKVASTLLLLIKWHEFENKDIMTYNKLLLLLWKYDRNISVWIMSLYRCVGLFQGTAYEKKRCLLFYSLVLWLILHSTRHNLRESFLKPLATAINSACLCPGCTDAWQ